MDDLTAAAAANVMAANEQRQAHRKKGWAKEALNAAKAHRPQPVPAVASSAASPPQPSLLDSGAVPWWVIFVLCVYLCVKLMTLYESPCAILGIESPATKKSIAKAYRTLSKCTHPDRLVKLGAEAQERGEMLFRRIADAKADISSVLERGPGGGAHNVSCYAGGGAFAAEAMLLEMAKDALATSDGRASAGHFLQAVGQGLVEVVTFEHGVVAVVVLVLTTMTVSRHCCALRREAAQQSCAGVLLRIPVVLLYGPVEVTLRLLTVPLLRWGVFVDDVLRRYAGRKQRSRGGGGGGGGGVDGDAGSDGEDGQSGDDDNSGRNSGGGSGRVSRSSGDCSSSSSAAVPAPRSTAGIAPSSSSNGPRRRAARSRQESKTQRTERETSAVVGSASAQSPSSPDAAHAAVQAAIAAETSRLQRQQLQGCFARVVDKVARQPLLRGVGRLHRTIASLPTRLELAQLPPGVRLGGAGLSLSQGQDFAAGAVQNDFVLSITKPIIPLALLIATGENISGFWFSVSIMYLLQRIPKMGARVLRLALFCFGLVHTFLEASAVRQVETSAGDIQVVLKWQWSLSDVLLSANLVLMGATFTAVSRAGNAPGLLSSFASGVAVRIVVGMHVPPAISDAAGGVWEALFPADDMRVQFQPASEVSSWAGGGVGDCGGGPLRMLLSDLAPVADVLVRAFLIVLPVLHTAQWAAVLHRSLFGASRLSVRRRPLQLVPQLVGVLGALTQCYLVARLTLDGLNGSLVGFFMVLVLASHIESLLNTYDVRGSVRQVLNYVIFVLL
jgi:hypothetical protein